MLEGMRLLSLDFDPVYGENATRSTFSSQVSAFDYDVVIWDPKRSASNYEVDSLGALTGLARRLTEASSLQILSDIKRRREEFAEFLNLGRTLIVLAASSEVRLHNTATADLLKAVPIDKTKFIGASGDRVDWIGGGPVVEALKRYLGNIRYAAVIEDPPGVPYARIQGTTRSVGSIEHRSSAGNLILLPFVDLRAPLEEDEVGIGPDDDDYWLTEAEQFQTDLLAAVMQLSGSSSISKPLWAENYMTTEQARNRLDVTDRQKGVEVAQAELVEAQQKKEMAELKNQLFLGTGRALELEVKKVLERLGGEVTEPSSNRDDWKITFPEGRVVCEVKGVSKSAAEKHAAQLEKWVSSEYDETGELPKGFLVVNTWREIPLAERSGVNFPDQMIPYCESRGHCLISGLQLFVILADIEKNPERSAHWRNLIMTTRGVVEGCDDWRSVLDVQS
jgi:hypothetical protein